MLRLEPARHHSGERVVLMAMLMLLVLVMKKHLENASIEFVDNVDQIGGRISRLSPNYIPEEKNSTVTFVQFCEKMP